MANSFAGLDPSLLQMARVTLARSGTSGGSGTPEYDPSAGGGSLNIAGLDTGIPTPQWLDRLLAGTGQGMTDIVRHAGNLVGLESNQDLADAKTVDAPLLDTTAGRIGQMIGQTALTAPIMGGATAGLARLGGAGAQIAGNALARGAVEGAAQGALTADPGQRLTGALLGGTLGTALPVAGAGVGKIVQGISRTPEAQLLMDRGASLTAGLMNPKGIIANRSEQVAEGLPVLGGLTHNARAGAYQDSLRGLVNEAMPPGETLPAGKLGFGQMVDKAADSFQDAYDVGKGFPVTPKIVSTAGGDAPLSQAFQGVVSRPRLGVDPTQARAVGNQLQAQLGQLVQQAKQRGTGLQSDDLLQLRSLIREAARDVGSDTQGSRALRGLWNDAASQVTAALDSQLPADAMSAVRATDQQYAKFAIVRDAARLAKDRPEGPTPTQLSTAVAWNTDPNLYARGGGLLRDHVQAMGKVFGNTIPLTGLSGAGHFTAPAAIAAMTAEHFPAAASVLHTVAPVVGGAAGTYALANLTRGGRAALAGNTGWQRALQGGLLSLDSAVPQVAQNVGGRYARGAVVSGLLGPRIDQ